MLKLQGYQITTATRHPLILRLKTGDVSQGYQRGSRLLVGKSMNAWQNFQETHHGRLAPSPFEVSKTLTSYLTVLTVKQLNPLTRTRKFCLENVCLKSRRHIRNHLINIRKYTYIYIDR